MSRFMEIVRKFRTLRAERPRKTATPNRRCNYRSRFRVGALIDYQSRKHSVKGIDLHQDGASVISKVPIPAGASIFIQITNRGLMGFARVRYCRARTSSTYIIGMEFCAPLMRGQFGEWSIRRIST